ncbi:MAG: M4 family metallopeptidase [Phycisphaerales bacterium]|nr:M4 family metallopeptidase [Phycisphaerales bacterium]MCB9862427.1 M4 family metallopeptidase [Phycisphaerales bacterium]
MKANCRCVNCITPPHILKRLLESSRREVREAAMNSLLVTARLRGERAVRAKTFAGVAGVARRTIYDCGTSYRLSSANVARTESDGQSSDSSVNLAFDGLGTTREFFREVLGRDSIDGAGMRLNGYVHYGLNYNNAFWDGQEMVFGDGDGVIFSDFTKSLDVIAHELTHGVTEFTANLEYHKQSGALNESISDVFGSLVKQWSLGQTAEEADWLIGADITTPEIELDALRSMKAPGTAYDNDVLGKDPQPDHMDRFVHLPDTEDGDWAGVHYNSGIPNKAFYLAAIGIGGFAWNAPGDIWYKSLLASHERTDFQEFAETTYRIAGADYGCSEQTAVADAWRQVGIRIAGATSRGRNRKGGDRDESHGPRSESANDCATLADQIKAIANQVEKLARDVKALKK